MVKVHQLKQSLSIMRDGGCIIDDPKDISDHVVFYFKDLFTADLAVRDIGLVAQVPGADSVTQLRPIDMANFVFKLVTKIIANRLRSIAAQIISPNQSAFLKGRTIADPIIMTSECINLLDRDCKACNIAIKFDVRKAFDTLDWGFLLRVLEAFGFSNLFQDLIKAILGSAHLSILINGATEGFFTCSRGVRQGDPLSPILFCLAEEVLSRGISKLVEEGHIDLLSAPLGITPPSHVLFADDIMVFMRGTKRSLKTLMHFMEEYGLNSGQQVNKAKSLVFLGKCARVSSFHLSWCSNFPGSSEKNIFSGHCRQRDPLKRGMSLVAWRQCCKPKEEGGLGLRDLFEANRALIKRCWDVLFSSSPASVLLRARFLKEDFQPLKSYKRSSIWLGLKKVWPTFFNSLQWCVGDGRKISFWLDNWLGKPLASSIGVIGFIPLHAKVNEFIVDSHYALPAAFTNLFSHVADKINKMTLPIVGIDSLIWPESSS
ncbi:hypothetical protein ACLB2K_013648 [Fragaria x ananassa]